MRPTQSAIRLGSLAREISLQREHGFNVPIVLRLFLKMMQLHL
jgi:hypothetical protein